MLNVLFDKKRVVDEIALFSLDFLPWHYLSNVYYISVFIFLNKIMKWTVKKLFRPNGVIEINVSLEIDEKWKVIDINWNWYTEIPDFWKVTKVDLAWILQSNPARTDRTEDADDLSATAFMGHKAEWANALLRNSNGAITEALFEIIQN
jgi:hypothetical protein